MNIAHVLLSRCLNQESLTDRISEPVLCFSSTTRSIVGVQPNFLSILIQKTTLLCSLDESLMMSSLLITTFPCVQSRPLPLLSAALIQNLLVNRMTVGFQFIIILQLYHLDVLLLAECKQDIKHLLFCACY